MKNVFFIVDCSGSISTSDEKIAQINDLLTASIDTLKDSNIVSNIYVIRYSDDAYLYCEAKKNNFLDLPTDKFDGRSNLGKAYILTNKIINNNKLLLDDCVLILISDGEATDNYRKELENLKGSTRVSISFGSAHFTTISHASNPALAFKNGIRDRDNFLVKIDDISLGV